MSVSYFFLHSPMSLFFFNYILGESSHTKTLELYFMSSIWNEMLTSRVEVLACVYVYVILIIRSMKRFSLRVTSIWQNSMSKQVAYVEDISCKHIYLALVGILPLRNLVILNFQNKIRDHYLTKLWANFALDKVSYSSQQPRLGFKLFAPTKS